MSATFEAEWARCAPWLQAALDRSPPTHLLEDVQAAVTARDARFWAGANAALVTEIISLPRAKVLNIWLGGGDLSEIRDHLVPSVEKYAADSGCSVVLIVGRPGWARALGYQPVHQTCMKELP